jgi:hypothetical protein
MGIVYDSIQHDCHSVGCSLSDLPTCTHSPLQRLHSPCMRRLPDKPNCTKKREAIPCTLQITSLHLL